MSHPLLKITLVQMPHHVGDLSINVHFILNALRDAKANKSDLIVFPEMALTGYTPEDILKRSSFPEQVYQALDLVAQAAEGIEVLLGAPHYTGPQACYNAVFHCRDKQIAQVFHKRALPNYGVFDEKRYFLQGYEAGCIQIKEYKIGVLICEEGWQDHTVAATLALKPDLLIQLNASPFEVDKQKQRYELVRHIAQTHTIPMLSLNFSGAQDEVIFDGGSFVIDQAGELIHQSPFFVPDVFHQTLVRNSDGLRLEKGADHILPSPETQQYQAMMLGLKSYAEACGFQHFLLGLSGGIDSALTLTIAADALGPHRITAVMMPSPYTSDMSIEDARTQAKTLGVNYSELPIQAIVQALENTLSTTASNGLQDITQQNLQARARGMLLMGLANQMNGLVLTTSNKSELAVGYATLYGDMAGGYNVLKDVYKTQVYALALYRNSISSVIPLRVLTRAPSAELKPNQTDQDTLPSYEMLDAILEDMIEHHLDEAALVTKGFDAATVQFIQQKLQHSEYKRKQSAPGPKLSACAFGKDWRMPIMRYS